MMRRIPRENLCTDKLASALVILGCILAPILCAGAVLLRVDTTGSMGFRWYYRWPMELHAGTVVEFRLPQATAQKGYQAGILHTPDRILLKRVAGVPGDHIYVGHDGVYINGEQQPGTELIQGIPLLGISEYTIAPRHYFVLGDQRVGSWDSRYFGPVQVQGTLLPLPF